MLAASALSPQVWPGLSAQSVVTGLHIPASTGNGQMIWVEQSPDHATWMLSDLPPIFTTDEVQTSTLAFDRTRLPNDFFWRYVVTDITWLDAQTTAPVPHPDFSPQPAYPASQLSAQEPIEDYFVAKAHIGADGRVTLQKVDYTPHADFTASVVETLAGWRCLPATRNGQPQAATVRLTFEFTP